MLALQIFDSGRKLTVTKTDQWKDD